MKNKLLGSWTDVVFFMIAGQQVSQGNLITCLVLMACGVGIRIAGQKEKK